jgi:hypothetical protein
MCPADNSLYNEAMHLSVGFATTIDNAFGDNGVIHNDLQIAEILWKMR